MFQLILRYLLIYTMNLFPLFYGSSSRVAQRFPIGGDELYFFSEDPETTKELQANAYKTKFMGEEILINIKLFIINVIGR